MMVIEEYNEKEINFPIIQLVGCQHSLPEMRQSDLHSPIILFFFFFKEQLIQEVSLEISCGLRYFFNMIICLQTI